MLGDLGRILGVVLLSLAAAQSVWIVYFYEKVRHRLLAKHKKKDPRGILPLHVILVTVATLALAFEAAIVNYREDSVDFWLWFNLAVLALINYSLWLVLGYERRRYTPRKETRKHDVPHPSP